MLHLAQDGKKENDAGFPESQMTQWIWSIIRVDLLTPYLLFIIIM